MTLGTQTQPYGKLLDYEQFIDHQLARTRARIKMTDILTALFILFVGLAGTLLMEVVLDHAFGLPLFVRRVILVLGSTSALAFFLLRIVLPLVLRINGVYAAKTIEGADPSFKNSLVNYLTLRTHRERMSKAVLATLEARAVNDLAHVEVEQVVNQQHLMKAFYTLCGVVGIFAVYAAFAPKSILDSAKRAFLADIVRPTNTRLLSIKPGNAEVVAGEQVLFSVDVNHGVRPEKVKLHYSADGGKFYAVKELEPGTNYYDPWQTTLSNVQQTMDYYMTGGDAESLHYTLTVLPAPMITSVRLDYAFPKYTQIPPRKGIEGGSVEAIEGTEVTVHATTNEPARAGTLNLTTGEIPPMTVSADDSHQLTGKFVVTKSGTYTINFRTTGGQLNPNPVVHDIIAIADRPPQARFLRPDRPTTKVPANVKVDMIMTGSDDHGVKDATLHVNLENESLVSKNVLEGRPVVPEFKATEIIDLAQLRVRPGSKLRYWLTVRDNYEPTSHSVQTAAQLIEVGEPVAPAEKQKIEENQAKDRQQFEPPPPADPQSSDQAVPPEEQTRPEDQPKNPQEQENRDNAKGGGQGGDRQSDQAKGTARDAANPNPDGGAGNPGNEAGPGPENATAGQRPPANDPQLKKLTEGLQKKGLLNPEKSGNPPPGSANPQEGQRGNENQKVEPGTQNQTGPQDNAANQGSQTRPRMENPGGTVGNPGSKQPEPQKSQGESDSAHQVQSGQKDAVQPRGESAKPSDTAPAGPNQRRNDRSASGQPNPGQSQPPKTADESVAKGQQEKHQGDAQSPGEKNQEKAQEPKSNLTGSDKSEERGSRPTAKKEARPDSSSTPSEKSREQSRNADQARLPQTTGSETDRPMQKGQESPGTKAEESHPQGREPKDATGTDRTKDKTSPGSKDERSGRTEGQGGEKSGEDRPGAKGAEERDASGTKMSGKQTARQNSGSKDQTRTAQETNPGTSEPAKTGPTGADRATGKEQNAGEATQSGAQVTDQERGDQSSKSNAGEQGPGADKGTGGSSEKGQMKDKKSSAAEFGSDKAAGKPDDKTKAQGQAGKTGDETTKDQTATKDQAAPKDQTATKDQSRGSKDAESGRGQKEGSGKSDSEKNKAQSSKGSDKDAGQENRNNEGSSSGRRDRQPGAGDKNKKPEGQPGGTETKDQASEKSADKPVPASPPEQGTAARNRQDRTDDEMTRDQSGKRPGAEASKESDRTDRTAKTAEEEKSGAGEPSSRRPSGERTGENRGQTGRDDQAEKNDRTSRPRDTSRDPREPSRDQRGQVAPRQDRNNEKPDASSDAPRDPSQTRPRETQPQSPPREQPRDQRDEAAARQVQRQADDTKDQSQPISGEESRAQNRTPQREGDSQEKEKQDHQGAQGDPSKNSEKSGTGQRPGNNPGQNPNMPAKQGQAGQGRTQNTEGQPQGPGQGESGKASSDNQGGQETPDKPPSGSQGSKAGPSQGRGEQAGTGSNNKASSESQAERGNESGTGKSGERGSTRASEGQKPGEGTGKGSEGSEGKEGRPEHNEAGQKGGESSHGSAAGQESEKGGEHSSQGNQPGASGSSQPAGGQPTGEPGQGQKPGAAGRTPIGGGGVQGAAPSELTSKDDSDPSPPSVEPENDKPDDIAPKGQSQTEMVLRTVKDLLAKDQVTPDIEKATGMTREQMEQWVEKYAGVKSPAAGPGREIPIKPGEQDEHNRPSANLPGIDRQNRFSTKNLKDRGAAPKDDVRNNLEGIRFTPPPEYRSKFEGYKSALAKTRSAAARAARPAAPAGR
jgi:hypothetical protein